jgi:hypothetical protein
VRGGQQLGVIVLYETSIDYERQESASQVIAMLDDIADAIWTLSDEKMPPEKKNRAQASLDELRGIVRSLPQPLAAQLAGMIASHFMEGG